MGVSVENQRWASRIDDLRTVPAAVRFLSCEPLLGPLERQGAKLWRPIAPVVRKLLPARTPLAALAIALDLADEGLIDARTALARTAHVDVAQLERTTNQLLAFLKSLP